MIKLLLIVTWVCIKLLFVYKILKSLTSLELRSYRSRNLDCEAKMCATGPISVLISFLVVKKKNGL